MAQRSTLRSTYKTVALISVLCVIATNGYGASSSSIAGTVRDKAGLTIAGAAVFAVNGDVYLQQQTDKEGHYRFAGLKDGKYVIAAMSSPECDAVEKKTVQLAEDEVVGTEDFRVSACGSISGVVRDSKRMPAAGMTVTLISQEYSFKSLRWIVYDVALTDSKGIFKFDTVAPGQSFLIQAKRTAAALNSQSGAALNAQQRHPIMVPTYYPSETDITAGEKITVAEGEKRADVTIIMREGQSLCLEGRLSPSGKPSAVEFSLVESEPKNGTSGDRTVLIKPLSGQTNRDGAVRVCELHAGTYSLAVSSLGEDEPSRAEVELSFSDRDIKGFVMPAQAAVDVHGMVTWYGARPNRFPEETVKVSLLSPRRVTFFAGEGDNLATTSSIPGSFNLRHILSDAYQVRISNLPSGLYLKDILSGGISVIGGLCRPEDLNGDLTVLIANDGGLVRGHTVDSEGRTAPNMYVFLCPTNIVQDADLSAGIIAVESDQKGAFEFPMTAPGKYWIMSSTTALKHTPEFISRIVDRLRSSQVDVAANSTLDLVVP